MKTEEATAGGGADRPPGRRTRVTAEVQGNKVKMSFKELVKLGKFEIVLPPCQVNLVRCDPQVRQHEQLRRRRRRRNQRSDATASGGDGAGHQQRYRCDQCPRHYATKNGLFLHKKIHKDRNCYRCPTCRKLYLTHGGLLYHRRTHTGLKPFRCTKCSATFLTNSALQTHLFHHSGERCYGCGVCGKRYTTRDGLEYHTRAVARCGLGFEAYRLQVPPRDKIPCTLCGRSYFLQADLTNHMRYHRGEGDKTGRRKLA